MPYLPKLPLSEPESILFVVLTSLDDEGKKRLKLAVTNIVASICPPEVHPVFAFCKNSRTQAIYEAAGKHGTNADIYEVSVRSTRADWGSVVVLDSISSSRLMRVPPTKADIISNSTVVLAQTTTVPSLKSDQPTWALRTHAVRLSIKQCLEFSLNLLDPLSFMEQEEMQMPKYFICQIDETQDYSHITRMYDPDARPLTADNLDLAESLDISASTLRIELRKSLPVEIIEKIIIYSQTLDTLPPIPQIRPPLHVFEESYPVLEIQAVSFASPEVIRNNESDINCKLRDSKCRFFCCKIHPWLGEKPATRQDICSIHENMLECNPKRVSSMQAQLFCDLWEVERQEPSLRLWIV